VDLFDELTRARLVRLGQEIAVVDSIVGSSARVRRAGQTNPTRPIRIATGLTLSVGDRVLVQRLGGNINTAMIVAKV